MYAVTASPATAVTHAVTGAFTSRTAQNLVVAKGSRFELYAWRAPEAAAAAATGGDASSASSSSSSSSATAAAAAAAGSSPLELLLEVPVYGRITALALFPLGQSSAAADEEDGGGGETLLVLTERLQLLLLQWRGGELVTPYRGDLSDAPARPADVGHVVAVDPRGRCVAVHAYDGLVKIIPLNNNHHNGSGSGAGSGGSGAGSEVGTAFNNRIEELQVLDMAFLDAGAAAVPTLAVLYQDARDVRNLKTYEVRLDSMELAVGSVHLPQLDEGASLLAPVPAPAGGILVMGEECVMHYAGGAVSTEPFDDLLWIRAVARIDADGARWLAADHRGTLHVLALHAPVAAGSGGGGGGGAAAAAAAALGARADLRLQPLGHTSAASALAYLSHGYVFVGSATGDSQLIRLRRPDEAAAAAGEDAIVIVDTFPNLGPITDLTVVGLQQQQQQQQQQQEDQQGAAAAGGKAEETEGGETGSSSSEEQQQQQQQQGQGQIVACSGAYQDGSLRIVRSGIGIEPLAEAPFDASVKSMWGLRSVDATKAAAAAAAAAVERAAAASAAGDAAGAEAAGARAAVAARAADDYLLLSDASGATTVLCVGDGEEEEDDGDAEMDQGGEEEEEGGAGLAQTEIPGFDEEARTLACASATIGSGGASARLVQVTPAGVNVCSADARVAEWRVPGGRGVQAASANEAGQILAASGQSLYYLVVRPDDTVACLGKRDFPHEIACVDATPLSPLSRPFAAATVAAVCLWTDVTLRLVALPEPGSGGEASEISELEEVCCVDLEEELHARSVLLQCFQSTSQTAPPRDVHCVFAGLGDGHLLAFEIQDDVASGRLVKRLVDRRKVSLGTQPITLVAFTRASATTGGEGAAKEAEEEEEGAYVTRNVFVCGDRPTVVYADTNGRLRFSNVNTRRVASVCSFNTTEFGDNLALAQDYEAGADGDEEQGGGGEEDEEEDDEEPVMLLTIGGVDDVENLQKVTARELGEHGRRIAYDPRSSTLAVVTVRNELVAVPDPVDAGIAAAERAAAASTSSTAAAAAAAAAGGGARAPPGKGEVGTDPVADAAGDAAAGEWELVDEKTVSGVLMLDSATYEPISRTQLPDDEVAGALTLVTATVEGPAAAAGSGGAGDKAAANSTTRPLYVVGTGIEADEETEPVRGRVLVFDPAHALASRAPAAGGGSSSSSGASSAADAASTSASTSGVVSAPAVDAVCSAVVGGAVYSVTQLQSRPNTIAVAVNSKVVIFELVANERQVQLHPLCEHYGAIVCLKVEAHGDFIVVADMMRSVSLLRFTPGTPAGEDGTLPVPAALEEIGRDFYPNWMTAVTVVDADTFLGAENNANLFIVRRNAGAANEEERGRLDTVARFHLGEQVNVFARGSLVMPSPAAAAAAAAAGSGGAASVDGDVDMAGDGGGGGASSSSSSSAAAAAAAAAAASAASGGGDAPRELEEWLAPPVKPNSTIVWGSVGGAVGLLCELTPEGFAFLQEVESAMRTVRLGVGGLKHADYRSFRNERLVAPATGFVDGDLVEEYLSLPVEQQARVAAALKADPAAVARRIELTSRALH